jgi:hypothetical protein
VGRVILEPLEPDLRPGLPVPAGRRRAMPFRVLPARPGIGGRRVLVRAGAGGLASPALRGLMDLYEPAPPRPRDGGDEAEDDAEDGAGREEEEEACGAGVGGFDLVVLAEPEGAAVVTLRDVAGGPAGGGLLGVRGGGARGLWGWVTGVVGPADWVVLVIDSDWPATPGGSGGGGKAGLWEVLGAWEAAALADEVFVRFVPRRGRDGGSGWGWRREVLDGLRALRACGMAVHVWM